MTTEFTIGVKRVEPPSLQTHNYFNMILTRTAALRKSEIILLAEEALEKRVDEYNAPKWDEFGRRISFDLRGEDRGNTYRFHLELSSVELVYLLKRSVDGHIPNEATHAVAIGALALLNDVVGGGVPAK